MVTFEGEVNEESLGVVGVQIVGIYFSAEYFPLGLMRLDEVDDQKRVGA